MSNGAQCCAIGVCCDAAKRRELLVSWIAEVVDEHEYCEAVADKLIAKMNHEDLVFAPASVKDFMDDMVRIAHKHKEATP